MTRIDPADDDARLQLGVAAFNNADFFEAGEIFEEIFFEAVSIGCLHAERGQTRAALGRLREMLKVVDETPGGHSLDFSGLRVAVMRMIEELERGRPVTWPQLVWRRSES
jgi:hypothetical protein